jgi:hypothetical protein
MPQNTKEKTMSKKRNRVTADELRAIFPNAHPGLIAFAVNKPDAFIRMTFAREKVMSRTERPKQQWVLLYPDFDKIAVVHADDGLEANADADISGCNPGGPVVYSPIPASITIPAGHCYRLLTAPEMLKLLTEEQAIELFGVDYKLLCEECPAGEHGAS